MHDSNERPAVMTRTMELVVAAFIFALGVIVIYDAHRIGWGWADDGPESGYFPFYIGVIICVSSFVIFVLGALDKAKATKSFVSRPALALVMKVLVPTIVYVFLVGLPNEWFGISSETPYVLGLYLASFLFIAFFMWRIGKYGLLTVLPVSIGVPVVFFLLFEVWFKIPLPKGLFEAQFGLL